MRPTQRKVAAKNMLELRTAKVDADSVGSDTSLSALSMSMLQRRLRFVLCQDEFSKALTLLRRGTRFGAAPRGDGAPSAMLSNSSKTGKTSEICDTFVFRVRKAAYAWVRRIRTVRPRFKRARLENVTVIPAQRENPLIEISVILTQCDRALI